MGRSDRKAARRGQGLVEFALAMPVLLLILLGIIEMGRLLFLYSSVASASREAARYGAAVDNFSDCTGIHDAAKRVGFFAGIADGDITIYYDNLKNGATHTGCPPPASQIQPGTRIIVYVSSNYEPIVPIVPVPDFTIQSNNTRTIISNLYLVQNTGGGGGGTPPPPPPPPPTAAPPTPTSEVVATPTVVVTMHVGDIDVVNIQTSGGSANWRATVSVSVHDSNHNPVSSVNVQYKWTYGSNTATGSCTTNAAGTCQAISANNSANPKLFEVTNLTGSMSYTPVDNHDPDGDSNGTLISIAKP
jgi:hypothetical protein